MSIKVLIVDDSAFMRKVLSEILSGDKDIEVVGRAYNGKDAVSKARELDPDVITMDINMPVMDGIEALKQIMAEGAKPVIMISAQGVEESKQVISALEKGAIDFIQKPSGEISLDLKNIGDDLIRKVKAAAKARIAGPRHSGNIIHGKFSDSIKKIVVIGTSTGGPQTLERVIPVLPKNIPACVLVVQHMPAGFTKSFSERLSKMSDLEVREAQEGDIIRPGVVYVAPGDYHMEVARIDEGQVVRDIIRLNQNEKELGVRPNVNVLMRSIAPLYREKTIGIILTGMGTDGTEGARAIKANGGTVLVQDKDSSIIYGMPRSVVEAGYYDEIVELDKLPVALIQILEL